MRKQICEVENCEDDIAYPTLGLCAACYSGIRYWRDRSPAEVLKRRQQISRLQGRMGTIQPWLKVLRDKQKQREQAVKAKIRNAKRATKPKLIETKKVSVKRR